jgi:mycofactocin system glycosyltransferase
VLRFSPAGWDALRALESGVASGASALLLGRRLLDAGIAHPRPEARDPTGNVTVVIPVRNRCAELDRCLAALDPGGKVIVVDDGSGDSQSVALAAGRHGALCLRRPASGGPAAARNSALSSVDSTFVAFLDSDCVPSPGWLHALVGHFDDPAVAAVAPRVRAAPASLIGAGDRCLASRSPLDMGGAEAQVVASGRVPYVPSAALVVRRTALAEGFDEGLRYGEDVDLVWRLIDAGWRVRYDPRVTVYHQEPAKLVAALRRRFRYGTSAGALAARHGDRVAPAAASPGAALVVLFALAGRPAVAAVIAAQRSVLLAGQVSRLGLPRAWGARWFAQAVFHCAAALAHYLAIFAPGPALLFGSRRARRLVLGASTVLAVGDWWREDASARPLTWIARALAGDTAYGAGVVVGCVRHATARPLVPVLRGRL